MTSEQWRRFRDEFFSSRDDVHKDRNHRYAHDVDILANFKRNAYGRLTALETWRTYAGKHWDSICSLVDDLAHGKHVTPALGEKDILGSFYDLANYVELGAALVAEATSPEYVDVHDEVIIETKTRDLVIVDLDDTIWDFVGEIKKMRLIPRERLMSWGGLSEWLGDEALAVFTDACRRMEDEEPFEGAVYALQAISSNYRIGIVTSRHHGHLNGIRAWLDAHQIPYEFILTDQQDKVSTALGLGATVIIDDRMETLQQAADSGIRAACLCKMWNMDAEDDDRIYRFDNWAEIQRWLG